MGKKVAAFLKGDPVFTVSLCLAVLSCGIRAPGPAYVDYIDFGTLIMLFCLMLVMEGLRRENFLGAIGSGLLRRVHTARGLSLTLVFLCFFSSMFMTNDVALLTFVPFGIMVLEAAGMSGRLCFTVTLMTIAANLGSMFTPMGNPQNLYLYTLSGLSLPEFLALTGPYAAGAALGLLGCVLLGFRQEKPEIQVEPTPPVRKGSVAFYGVLFVLCVLTVAGLIPHGVLLVIVAAAIFWKDKSLFARADYALLATFVFFFIFVGNLNQIDSLRAWIMEALAGRERLFGVALSQIISNVPAAMLLSGYSGNVPELIVGTNLGGLGTLIASMASLISYKQIANRYPGEKKRYLLVFTVCNLAFLLVLYWL